MGNKYSGKKVNKAGEILIKDNVELSEFEEAMDVLSYWRLSHEVPLDAAVNLLKETTLKIDKSAIFAKRSKRYVSIVLKLKRFKDMKLKNMQDIGGCRAIVSNRKALHKVVKSLRKIPVFKNSEGKIRCKDYISKPKDDGYRGYHLIGHFKDEQDGYRNIEIQVRTRIQHDWATALEIVDLFTDQALKSNQGDKDWRRFFAVVSKQFAVMEREINFDGLSDDEKYQSYLNQLKNDRDAVRSCIDTQVYANKLKTVEKFNAFTQSLRIVDGRLDQFSEDGYVLVEVDTVNREVHSTLFNKDQNMLAEDMYIEAEKRVAEEENIVVALVSTTAVGGIKTAYPNYFADSTEFLKYLTFILNVRIERNMLLDLFNQIRNIF